MELIPYIHFYRRYFYRQQKEKDWCRFTLDVYREILPSCHNQDAVFVPYWFQEIFLFPSIADAVYLL